MTRAAILFMLAAIVCAAVALGAPPEGGPGPFSDWYRSLVSPTGGSCCDQSDCRPVRFRVVGNEIQVLITPETHGQLGVTEAMWVDVPPEKMLQRDNPTGMAVACWLPSAGVLCFVPPPMI